jgi:cell division septal protein FtsQ
MKIWKPDKEHYSVIIASETDARKKTLGFVIKRRTVRLLAAAGILVVAAFAVLITLSVFQASYFSAKADELKSKVLIQSSLLDTYSDEIDSLGSELEGWQQKLPMNNE